MIRGKLFNENIDILREAFFKGTLKHGSGCECAVANLISAHGGVPLGWTYALPQASLCCSPHELERALIILAVTGYTKIEIGKIENAFERAEPDSANPQDPDGFKGLMNVVDVLSEIHKVDLTKTKKVKTQFVKA